MEYSSERLEKLHSTLLEILDYIDLICSTNNLTYFLAGGTALGAKRHGGFIPWDDDLDIFMPRQDYNLFLELVKTDNSQYSIQNETNERNYHQFFSKIRKKGTLFREEIVDGLYEDNGIFVDIFPFDFADNISSIEFKRDSNNIRLMRLALQMRYCKDFIRRSKSTLGYLKAIIITLPYCFMSKERIYENTNRLMQKRNNLTHNYVVCFTGMYGERDRWDLSTVFPPQIVMFEGKRYPTFAKLDEYLSQTYGDYMKLPPEEKRHSHEPLEIRF